MKFKRCRIKSLQKSIESKTGQHPRQGNVINDKRVTGCPMADAVVDVGCLMTINSMSSWQNGCLDATAPRDFRSQACFCDTIPFDCFERAPRPLISRNEHSMNNNGFRNRHRPTATLFGVRIFIARDNSNFPNFIRQGYASRFPLVPISFSQNIHRAKIRAVH